MSYGTTYQKYVSFETITSGTVSPDVEHSSSHAMLYASGSGSSTSLYFFDGAGENYDLSNIDGTFEKTISGSEGLSIVGAAFFSNNVSISGTLTGSLMSGTDVQCTSLKVNSTIGPHEDTDLMTLALNTLTVAGTVNAGTALSASTTISGRGLVLDADGVIGTSADADLLTLESGELKVAGAIHATAGEMSSSGQISGQKILLDTNDGYIGSVGDTDLLKISASLLVVNGVASASLSLKGNDLVIGNFETIGTDQDTDLISLCSNNVHVSGVLSSSLGLNGNSLRIGSGQTIGCYGDTDLLTLTANTLTVAGTVNVSTAVSASTTISGRGLVIDTDGTIGTAGDADLLTLENGTLEVAGIVSGSSFVLDPGKTIGTLDDTDLLTLTTNTVTVAGTVNVATAVSASTTISGRGLVLDADGVIGTSADADLLTLESGELKVAGACHATAGEMSASSFVKGIALRVDTNGNIGTAGDTDLITLENARFNVSGTISGSSHIYAHGAITSSQGISVEGLSLFHGGTVTFGESGEGEDVTFYGDEANNVLLWDVTENALIVKDGGTETVRMGGDATTDYAIDVGNGSAGTNNINKIRASAFVTFSDERLKSNVKPMAGALDTVNKLKAVNFTWRKDGTRDFGFLAQDLKKVIPQAVHGNDEGLFGVDYGRLTSILVKAIQEQSDQIKALQKKLDE